MSPSDTTIIFVPGGWHQPTCFDQVAKELQSAGYNTDYVYLASVGPPKHVMDHGPDIAEVQKSIEKALSEGQKIVVLGHSYGGIIVSSAVKGYDYKSRQAAGEKGGVTHLFYCCSFVIPEGKSLIEAFGGNDLPWFNISEDKLEVNPDTPEKIFYNDLPESMYDDLKSQLKPMSYQPFHAKLAYAGWAHIPSTYLYCKQDNAIPTFVQEMMVNDFAGGAGVKIRTETVDASHSPFLSMPKETAAAIQRSAEIPV